MKLVPVARTLAKDSLSVKTAGGRFLFLAFACLLLQVLILFFFWKNLPAQLPLFYSRPWGEDQLATQTGILLLPALSLIVFVINFAFLIFVPRDERLIRSILVLTTTLFSFLSLITLVQIIRLAV